MKTLIQTVVLCTLVFATTAANAGAYHFYCSNPSGSVQLDKGELTLTNKYGQDIGKSTVTDYRSSTLDYAVEASDYTVDIVGKKTIISSVTDTNECGTEGTREVFAAEIEIKKLNSAGDKIEVLDKTTILCDEGGYSGHCI